MSAGWRRYGFDNLDFMKARVHGAEIDMQVAQAINRGVGQPNVSFGVVPPATAAAPIGMHVHRDLPSGHYVEEWYLIVSGHGEMTFSDGDTVELAAGDLVVTDPGVGHAFRALGDEPVRLVAVVPTMFTTDVSLRGGPSPVPPARIPVDEVDERTMNPVRAHCARCGAEWTRAANDTAAADLPHWARRHRHD